MILTALDLETAAVLRHLKDRTAETVGGTVFHRGHFEGWDVAGACRKLPGNPGAASAAVRAIDRYTANVALFVGIAGGVKDVEIGDVVVATKVYGYEAGKDLAGKFVPRPDVMIAAHGPEQRARYLRQNEDWKKRLDDRIALQAPRGICRPNRGWRESRRFRLRASTAEFYASEL